MNELIKQVERWSADKGLNKSDSTKQFLKVSEEFGEIAAATSENAKCLKFIDEETNALNVNWDSLGTIFCNPPYESKLQSAFIKKAYEESLRTDSKIVLLIPSRTDTARWHDYILGKAEVRFLRGRLKFENDGIPHKDAAPFPSAVVIFN